MKGLLLLCLLSVELGNADVGLACSDDDFSFNSWLCGLNDWMESMRQWKERINRDCSDDHFGTELEELFSCQDHVTITCCNETMKRCQTNAFNCDICYCSDGNYSDRQQYEELWRKYLISYRKALKLYNEKLSHCRRSTVCDATAASSTLSMTTTEVTTEQSPTETIEERTIVISDDATTRPTMTTTQEATTTYSESRVTKISTIECNKSSRPSTTESSITETRAAAAVDVRTTAESKSRNVFETTTGKSATVAEIEVTTKPFTTDETAIDSEETTNTFELTTKESAHTEGTPSQKAEFTTEESTEDVTTSENTFNGFGTTSYVTSPTIESGTTERPSTTAVASPLPSSVASDGDLVTIEAHSQTRETKIFTTEYNESSRPLTTESNITETRAAAAVDVRTTAESKSISVFETTTEKSATVAEIEVTTKPFTTDETAIESEETTNTFELTTKESAHIGSTTSQKAKFTTEESTEDVATSENTLNGFGTTAYVTSPTTESGTTERPTTKAAASPLLSSVTSEGDHVTTEGDTDIDSSGGGQSGGSIESTTTTEFTTDASWIDSSGDDDSSGNTSLTVLDSVGNSSVSCEDINSIVDGSVEESSANPPGISKCEIIYCEICFWTVAQFGDWYSAQETCKQSGANLANIYSEELFDAMVKNLIGKNVNGYIWTGMRFEENLPILSNGKPATFVKWASHQPTYNSTTHTVIDFGVFPENYNSSDGMWNWYPNDANDAGFVCEFH